MTVANELGFGLFTPMTLITLITLITLVTPNYPNYQDDHGNQNDFSLKHLITPIIKTLNYPNCLNYLNYQNQKRNIFGPTALSMLNDTNTFSATIFISYFVELQQKSS